MPTSPSAPIIANAADHEAAANFTANRAALDRLQPGINSLLHAPTESVEWIFARDGALTCLMPGERWWGDCSLPRRAGQFMFKKMQTPGVVACFLRPVHAAHLRVTLDMLEPQQAIVALVPEPETAWVLLRCGDFSQDIVAGRLWFAIGARWESQLAELFVANPGLPTPSQFIRPIAIDNEPADAMIAPAQKIFADESERRTAQIRSRVTSWKRPATMRKLCIVAPTRFRLWNDAPHALHEALSGSDFEITRFDSDSPRTASPAMLSKAAAACDATVTANISRADLPGVFPATMPLVTWVTFPRIPNFDASCPNDVLLLADESWQRQAVAAGWPTSQARLAGWPAAQAATQGKLISLIADTKSLDVPDSVKGYSSQRILWESILDELLENPFAVGNEVDDYLKRRQAKRDVDSEHLDRALFIEQLIVPAYQQGVARSLLLNQVPLTLHGKGWLDLPEFAPFASGPVMHRDRFTEILRQSAALIHAWPISYAHPIHAAGLPVIRASSSADLLRQVRAPRRQPARDERETLSAQLLRAALG